MSRGGATIAGWVRAAMVSACITLTLASFSPTARAQFPLPVQVVEANPTLLSSGPVIVRAESGMEVLAAQVAREAPVLLRGILADLDGLPRPSRIEIRLVKRAENLAAVAPPNRGAPAWAAGVAYPKQGVVSVATRRGAHSIDVMSTVAHELAHLALSAALTRDAVPRWLNEGFAYIHASEWSLERVQTLTGMAWSGNTIPIRELDRYFPEGEVQVGKAYAQSYDFVAFLAKRGRYIDRHDDGDRWVFRHFLSVIAETKNVDIAARRAYDASLDELYQEWHQTLRQRYLLLPVGMFALGVWVVAALLLVIGYIRRRRQNRRRLAQWAIDEAGLSDVSAE